MLKILFAFTYLALVGARSSHFYRKDYTFFEDFDAYYKLHWDSDGTSWNSAFLACSEEGAKLFFPREKDEWTIVKNLKNTAVESPNVTDVMIGIHDEFGQGEFVTVDGVATPSSIIEHLVVTEGQNCIIMDMETGKYKAEACETDPPSRRIFVCKKIDEKPCRTIDLEYKYSEAAKKCYKVNRRLKTWQEAWHTCFMEGGMLVSPENDLEAEIISNFIKYDPDNYYFSGFRKVFGKIPDYYNVKGQKLDETGFHRWYSNDQNLENCGVVFSRSSTLYIGTEVCTNTHSFICEMAAKTF